MHTCELISRLADDFLAVRVILILILRPWGIISSTPKHP